MNRIEEVKKILVKHYRQDNVLQLKANSEAGHQIDDYYCSISGVPEVDVNVLEKREAGWRRLNTAVTEITKGD